jgi:hypothetical protein
MKIGSELIAKVISPVNAALLKIKRTLTDAYHDLRHRVSVSQRELRLLVKKA